MGPTFCEESSNILIYPVSQSYNNIASILEQNSFSDKSKTCLNCKEIVSHFVTDSFDTLPSVLIVSLQRFETAIENGTLKQFKKQDCVVPSNLIPVKDTVFQIKSVIKHWGTQVSNGHYTTSLRKSNNWITCN